MLQEDKNILWKLSAVMLGMALPSMLLGKSVMMVCLALGSLTGLMATKDESLRTTFNLMLGSRFSLLVVAFLLASLLGVALGINPAPAFDRWQQLVLVALASVMLFVTFREMPGRHLETVLSVLVGSTLVVSLLGLLDALLGDPNISNAIHGPDKAILPSRLNYMSGVLAVILPFVAAHLITKVREGEPLALRSAPWVAAASILAVMVSGGSSGWAGFAVSSLTFVALAGRYHGLVVHRRHWGALLTLLVGGFALYIFAVGWPFFISSFTLVTEAGRLDATILDKLNAWKDALVRLVDYPLFGVGIMNSRNIIPGFDLHPNTWILQLLVETGLVGTALFCVAVWLVMRQFFMFAKGNLYGVAGFASVLAFLVTGLGNTSIFNIWWLLFLVFASLLGWRAGWGGADLKKRRRRYTVVKPNFAKQ
jgi:hypothetical protein